MESQGIVPMPMIGHATSFVLQATDNALFEPPSRLSHQNSAWKTTKLALGILIASVMVPVAGSLGALYHTGCAIVSIPARQGIARCIEVSFQDARFATKFIAITLITLAGIGLSPILIVRNFKTYNGCQPSYLNALVDFALKGLTFSRFQNALHDLSYLRDQEFGEGRFCHFSASSDTWKIAVSRKLIWNHPEMVLENLYKKCYIKTPKVESLEVTFYGEDSLDNGGPSREFLSDLFKSLSSKASAGQLNSLTFLQTHGGSLPVCNDQTKEGRFRYVGKQLQSFSDEELKEALQLAFPGEIPTRFLKMGRVNRKEVIESYQAIRNKIPPISRKEYHFYEVLGAIVGFSFRQANYPLGQVFSRALFDVLATYTYDELLVPFSNSSHFTILTLFKKLESKSPMIQRMFQIKESTVEQLKRSGNWNHDLFCFAFPDSDYPDFLLTDDKPDIVKLEKNFIFFQQAITEQLFHKAVANKSLPAIFSMARGMLNMYKNRHMWPKMNDADYLAKVVQGDFSKQMLVNHLVCSDLAITAFLNKWIYEAKDIEIENFLKAATGTTTLADSCKLNISVTPDTSRHIAFHTCLPQIDIPQYADYTTFKEKFEESIVNALFSGFTLR